MYHACGTPIHRFVGIVVLDGTQCPRHSMTSRYPGALVSQMSIQLIEFVRHTGLLEATATKRRNQLRAERASRSS